MVLQPSIPYSADNIKVRFFFQSPSFRWTLNLWNSQVGPTNLQIALGQAITLGAQIYNITATDVVNFRIECSCINSKRNTARSAAYNYPFATPLKYPENNSDDCVRLLMRGTNAYRSSIYLSGIADANLNNDAIVYTGTATFQPALTQFIALLTAQAGNWGVMANNAAYPRVRVLDVGLPNPVASTTPTITTALPHGLANAAIGYARLGRVPGASAVNPVNRIWQVQAVSPTQLDILNYTGNIATAWDLNGGGFVQIQSKVFSAFKACSAQVPGTHSRGVRTAAPRARQKVNRHLGWTPS